MNMDDLDTKKNLFGRNDYEIARHVDNPSAFFEHTVDKLYVIAKLWLSMQWFNKCHIFMMRS